MTTRSHFLVPAAALALSLLPAAADAQGRAASTTPSRDGFYIMGGFWGTVSEGRGNWLRVEPGIHLRRLTRADLYLNIPVGLTADDFPGGSYFGLMVTPGVRGDFMMLNRKGDLSLFLEGGGGLVLVSWDYDDRDLDGDSWIGFVARTGFGVSYTAPFGLKVSLQVVGMNFLIGGDGRGGYGNDDFWYENAFMLGYQWE